MWSDPQWPLLLTARLIDPGTASLALLVIVVAFTAIARWVKAGARPAMLIREGAVDGTVLRRCGVTDETLHAAIARLGLQAFAEVERAYVDHDGVITINPRQPIGA
jgi:uncharacterized membrane protein YcaP (DUF421 family)